MKGEEGEGRKMGWWREEMLLYNSLGHPSHFIPLPPPLPSRPTPPQLFLSLQSKMAKVHGSSSFLPLFPLLNNVVQWTPLKYLLYIIK